MILLRGVTPRAAALAISGKVRRLCKILGEGLNFVTLSYEAVADNSFKAFLP